MRRGLTEISAQAADVEDAQNRLDNALLILQEACAGLLLGGASSDSDEVCEAAALDRAALLLPSDNGDQTRAS